MASTQFLIATLLLLSLMHAGSTLKCYQYAEDKGKDGIYTHYRGVENLTLDCSNSCITHTYDTATGERVLRFCSDPIYCEITVSRMAKHMGVNTKSCTICDSDLCN